MIKYLILILFLATNALAYSSQEKLDDVLSAKSLLAVERLKDEIRQTMRLIELAEQNNLEQFEEFSYRISLAAYYQIRLGLILDYDEEENAFNVLSVSPNSLAKKAGIEVNDKILSINYERVNSKNSDLLVQYLQKLEVDEELTLEIKQQDFVHVLNISVNGVYIPEVDIQVGCCINKNSDSAHFTDQNKLKNIYTEKSKKLMKKLALTVQATAGVIAQYEQVDGQLYEDLHYKIVLPVTSEINLGLTINTDKTSQGFIVSSVETGSFADRVGISRNDLIVKVNDLPVNQENKVVNIKQLQTLSAGTDLHLSVKKKNKVERLSIPIQPKSYPPVIIDVGNVLKGNTEQNVNLGDESKIPEPFRGSDENSSLTISYQNLDQLLKFAVVEMGRSDRVKAKEFRANIGTRLRPTQKRLTSLEGNRFYFNAFEEEVNKKVLLKIQQNLAQIPDKTPLFNFSKKEQLAYWLNLYNVTVLAELIDIYPKRNLAFLFEGDDSLFSRKILTINNVLLSLNDIKNVILKEKFNYDADVLYGLYQGVIGGPNIRSKAYTGNNVYRSLANNATEFVNSNRGTYRKNKQTLLISNFYQENAEFFPNFEKDIKEHLLKHIEGSYRLYLTGASTIKATIENWHINDIYGTLRNYGGGNNANGAALLGAVNNSHLNKVLENSVLENELSMVSHQERQVVEQIYDKYVQNKTSVTVSDVEENNTQLELSSCLSQDCKDLFHGFDILAKKDRWASYYVSLLHFHGIGTEQSTERAIYRLNNVLNRDWFKHVFATIHFDDNQKIYSLTYYQLGYLHLVDKSFYNLTEAISNLSKSSELGDFRATYLLGLVYLTDEFQLEDYSLATKWLSDAQRQNRKAFDLILKSYGIDTLYPSEGFQKQIEQLRKAVIKRGVLNFSPSKSVSSAKNIENMKSILSKLKSAWRRVN